MKIILIIIMALGLTSCDSVNDFMYDNFSLQKNIDQAAIESRKNVDGDFEIDEFGYVFPPAVGRFVENGYSYSASLAHEAFNENMETIPAGATADIYLKKDDSSFYVEATNESSSEVNVLDAPISYIEISSFELGDVDFSLGDIKFGDALYEITAKVPDKEVIELRQNTKDAMNDQYYMYLNGQYVVIFTMYEGKLSQVEIIPNERFSQYE